MVRDIPELQTLVRGLRDALRSAVTTLLLPVGLIYVFAIVFMVQSGSYPNLKPLFPDLPATMWFLLFRGLLLDGPIDTLDAIKKESYILVCVWGAFVSLSCFTIANMLIGIICNVVDQVAQREKDTAAVLFLKTTLLDLLECHDDDDNRRIRKTEFELLMRNPEMHVILTRFGVNVDDLISLKDTLFEDKDVVSNIDVDAAKKEEDLSFAEFLRVVLRLRGGNAVQVNDIVELREYMKHNWRHQQERYLSRVDTLEQNLFGFCIRARQWKVRRILRLRPRRIMLPSYSAKFGLDRRRLPRGNISWRHG